jgi:hypothetical protein
MSTTAWEIVRDVAKQHVARGDDCGALARLVLAASPSSASPGAALRMLTEKETQDAYALDYADENFMDRDPTWMDRMNATIKRFCEVNGLSLSAAQGSEGGER